MLKKLFAVCFAVLSLGYLNAQTFIVNKNASLTSGNNLQNDTIKILAVLADFQEDKDATTFGNGKFGSNYSQDYGTKIIDPLPHNKSYFEAHLEFVKNYYQKASKGKVIVQYTVVPQVFTVSKTMRNYTTTGSSTDYTPLGNFAKEVWAEVDSANLDIKYSNYNLFIIFHAGVGRDISLPGSLDNEKDLPSVYLSNNALKKIYGSNFSGFPMSGGSFLVGNSMIMPETESRELSSFGQTVLFELTINGLLVANVASHLGLPDLFDTKTGLSAIGRFGLMDGQSIFAYNGVFPPEPSAWEKIYLGWIEPFELPKTNISYFPTIADHASAFPFDTTVVKVPISSSEYYLVENRQRDALKNGAVITYVSGNETLTRTFVKDTTGFYSWSIDSLKGVITDVDEFDWAIPGNGIVIWHIDENIINAKKDENKINNDKYNRGVDVEEADGIQDIGEKFTTVFGDEVVGEGDSTDLWYSGNISKLFKNRFGKDTYPSTTSNNGSYSQITISDFSKSSTRMSFKVTFGDSIIKPVEMVKINQLSEISRDKLSGYDLSDKPNFFIQTGDKLLLKRDNDVFTYSGILQQKPAVIDNQNYPWALAASINGLFLTDYRSNNSYPLFEKLTTSPVVFENSGYVGAVNGKVYKFDVLNNAIQVKDSILLGSEFTIKEICGNKNTLVIAANNLTSGKSIISYNGNIINLNEKIQKAALTPDVNSKNIIVALTEGNKFHIYKDGAHFNEFTVSSLNGVSSFSLGDIKNDGSNYIVITNDNKIEAYGLNGSIASNFPFNDPKNIGFAADQPVVVDFSGDSKAEIIASTTDGRIFAVYGSTGKVVDGFPLSTGASLKSTPSVYINNGVVSLAVINNDKYFYRWDIGVNKGTGFWNEENGNNKNTGYVSSASKSDFSSLLLPEKRVYNYPNPVYSGSTYIRYYTSEDAKVTIKIFDLAGELAAELTDNATGGFENETEWNISSVQSGIYLAHVELQGVSGTTGSQVIKIAVIK